MKLKSSHITHLRQSRFVNLLISLIAGNALAKILFLIGTIFLTHKMLPSSYGIFGLSIASAMTIGLFAGAGIGAVTTKYISSYENKNNSNLHQELNSLIYIFFILNGFTMISFIIFNSIINKYNWSLLPPELEVSQITALAIALSVKGMATGVSGGFKDFKYIARINVLESAVFLCLIMYVTGEISAKDAVNFFLLATIISTILITNRAIQKLSINKIKLFSRINKIVLTEVLLFSVPNVLSNLIGGPVLWILLLVLANSPNGLTQTGLFTSANQWHGPLTFLPTILMTVSLPFLSEKIGSQNKKQHKTLAKNIIIFVGFISLASSTFVSINSTYIMSFYGSIFADASLILSIISFGAACNSVSKVCCSTLLSMNKPWSIFAINLQWGVLAFAFGLFLVPLHGAMGLAWSLLGAYFLQLLTSMYVMGRYLKNET